MKNFEHFDHLPPRAEAEEGRSGGGEERRKGGEKESPLPPCSPAPLLPCSPAPLPPCLPVSPALLLYLIPVIGFFPSLWTLYRRQGSREQLSVSRVSVTLGLSWVLGYFLLAGGAATSEFLTLRLLILNSFLTSGYFLISVWLMVHTVRGKAKRLPGLSNFAERVLGKYLS